MKKALVVATLCCSILGASGFANAKGCLKGAAVGGVAGHVAGHHGVIGAAAGCAIGHHEAKVKDRKAVEDAKRVQQASSPPPNTTVQSSPK